MTALIIAVDPGASGGIAWRDSADVTQCIPMPETRKNCIEAFVDLVFAYGAENTVAYIEKIAGFIPDGGASQMFEFGKSVERVGCILETLGVRIIEVGPKEWQKALHLGVKEKVRATSDMNVEQRKAVKSENARYKTQWKNKLKSEAQRRFPQLNITLKTADALLILDYAIQQERAIQNTPQLAGI